MWEEDGWSGSSIYESIRSETTYLTWMHQLDCLLLYGSKNLGIKGYTTSKDDWGISVMPMGVSFELTRDGVPKRIGSRQAHTFGWFWGIPQNSSEQELAFKLAMFITIGLLVSSLFGALVAKNLPKIKKLLLKKKRVQVAKTGAHKNAVVTKSHQPATAVLIPATAKQDRKLIIDSRNRLKTHRRKRKRPSTTSSRKFAQMTDQAPKLTAPKSMPPKPDPARSEGYMRSLRGPAVIISRQ